MKRKRLQTLPAACTGCCRRPLASTWNLRSLFRSTWPVLGWSRRTGLRRPNRPSWAARAGLVLSLALLAAPALAAQVTVTYLGNEGFLLEGGGKKVLVDALFDGLRGYVSPPPEMRREMLSAEGLFEDVDLVLATHFHDDHFSPDPVKRHLQANPDAVFLSTPQAVNKLGLSSADGLPHRVHGTIPPEGRIEERTLNGVRVEILNLHHGRGRNPPVQNLGFIIHLGGRSLLHIGDTEATVEDWAPLGLSERTLDVALVPIWYLTAPRWVPVVGRHIQARHLAAMHIADVKAPAGYFGRHRSQANRIAAVEQVFPDAETFTQPGQSRRY